MSRTVTLQLPERIFDLFRRRAREDNRTLPALIQTAALRQLEHEKFAGPAEMKSILSNRRLTERLRAGSRAARLRQGRMIG